MTEMCGRCEKRILRGVRWKEKFKSLIFVPLLMMSAIRRLIELESAKKPATRSPARNIKAKKCYTPSVLTNVAASIRNSQVHCGGTLEGATAVFLLNFMQEGVCEDVKNATLKMGIDRITMGHAPRHLFSYSNIHGGKIPDTLEKLQITHEYYRKRCTRLEDRLKKELIEAGRKYFNKELFQVDGSSLEENIQQDVDGVINTITKLDKKINESIEEFTKEEKRRKKREEYTSLALVDAFYKALGSISEELDY